MTTVFIAGSRRLSRLNADVKRRIDRIVDQGFEVVVGDANGMDRAVQDYLRSRAHENVRVFCAGGRCRNNRGSWPVRDVPVPPGGPRRGFAFYALKDRAMADEASVGLMLWDGDSVGTLMNIQRLVHKGKKVVVYISPTREFVDVKTNSDWEALLSRCAPTLRARVEQVVAAENAVPEEERQTRLL